MRNVKNQKTPFKTLTVPLSFFKVSQALNNTEEVIPNKQNIDSTSSLAEIDFLVSLQRAPEKVVKKHLQIKVTPSHKRQAHG